MSLVVEILSTTKITYFQLLRILHLLAELFLKWFYHFLIRFCIILILNIVFINSSASLSRSTPATTTKKYISDLKWVLMKTKGWRIGTVHKLLSVLTCVFWCHPGFSLSKVQHKYKTKEVHCVLLYDIDPVHFQFIWRLQYFPNVVCIY